MRSYDLMTSSPWVRPVVRVLAVATIVTVLFGASRSSAQEEIPATVSLAATAPNQYDVIAALEAKLDEKDEQVAALQEQLAIARQASLEREQRIANQRNTILTIRQIDRESQDIVDEGYVKWAVGYRLGGGTNLRSFENVILPCESGGEPDPDVAIGPTDDWGRAQINRPTWSTRFEEVMGVDFETHILDPVFNGYMAAIVEQEHPRGLNAWTCWRRR